jgi:hypothetical protein
VCRSLLLPDGTDHTAVPRFWLRVLKSADAAALAISPRDAAVLACLADVRFSLNGSPSSSELQGKCECWVLWGASTCVHSSKMPPLWLSVFSSFELLPCQVALPDHMPVLATPPSALPGPLEAAVCCTPQLCASPPRCTVVPQATPLLAI